MTLKDQVAGPDRSLEVSPAEDVRLDAIGRTELDERRVSDEQLLVRSRSKRERFVPREDRCACREVEGDASRARGREGKRLRQPLHEWRRGKRGALRQREDGDCDERSEEAAAAHRAIVGTNSHIVKGCGSSRG